MGRDRQTGGRRDDHRQTAQDSQSAGSSPPVDPLCARGHLGRSSDSGSWNLVLFDSAGTRTHPGQGVPFGRRWDKEIGGGQEEGKTVTETEGRRDRRERGKEREPERGRSQIFVPPRRARPTGLWGEKSPWTTENGQDPLPPLRAPLPPAVPGPGPDCAGAARTVSGAVHLGTLGVGFLSPAGLSPGAAPGRRTHLRPRSSVPVPRSLGTCPGLAALWGPCRRLWF